jgi:predicted dehydrogenase
MKRIKAGIVGMGFIGPIHLEALRRLGYMDVCIATSNIESSKKSAEENNVSEYYSDWQELIEKSGIDVIHICTPNSLHYPIAKKAMEKGIHVICDKPLTLDIEEAKELTETAKQTGVINAVTFNTFYYPLVQQSATMIHNCQLGNINYLQGFYLQDWLLHDSDYNWRVESVYGGPSRVIGDIGSHCLFMIQKIIGQKIIKLYADFNTFVPSRKKPRGKIETYQKNTDLNCEEIAVDTEDQATLLLEFDRGARGVFIGGQTFPGRKNKLGFEIYGSEKSLAWDAENPNFLQIGERSTANMVLMKDFNLLEQNAARMCDFTGGIQEGFAETWKNLMKVIYSAIQKGKHTEGVYPTFEDGLHMQKIVNASYNSSVMKQWVEI